METRGIMRRQVCVTQNYLCVCSPMGKPDYFSGMSPEICGGGLFILPVAENL